jgi:hypothetical protein
MSAKDRCEHRQAAGVGATQDLARKPAYNGHGGVSDGGHLDAPNNATWRLHDDAETDQKAAAFAGNGAGRTSAGLFRSRRRKGRSLDRQRRTGH